jgi:carbon monoxide dehydrogenase subunit G
MASNFLILEPSRWQVAIAGRVTDAQTGQALSGVQVTITAAPAAFNSWLSLHAKQYEARWDAMVERADRTRTAKDGHYHFLDLPAGQYTLTASFPGVGSRYGTVDVKAKVVVSKARSDPGKISWVAADIALPPTTLKGQVTSADTQPVFFANVLIQGSGERTYSDAQGNYRLVGLEVGARTVQVSAQGYKTNSQTVQLSQAGVAQSLNIVLEK